MDLIDKTYLQILLQEKNFQQYSLDCFSPKDFLISQQILIQSFQNILTESDDPNYFIKFPKAIITLTKQKQILDKYDILKIFPEFQNIKFPRIFVSFFDFSNKSQVQKFLKSISKLKNKDVQYIFNLAFKSSQKRGFFIDLTKFKINLGFLIFNSKTFNDRTICHQWTHVFQSYVGNDFYKIIQLSNKNIEQKNKKLKELNLTFDIVQNYFFSQKEYVTRLDNLIYMIHQVQKLDKYKNLNDNQFFEKFKKLDKQMIQEILKIDKNFLVDIQFFKAAKICFDGQVFTKLCFDISQRI